MSLIVKDPVGVDGIVRYFCEWANEGNDITFAVVHKDTEDLFVGGRLDHDGALELLEMDYDGVGRFENEGQIRVYAELLLYLFQRGQHLINNKARVN